MCIRDRRGAAISYDRQAYARAVCGAEQALCGHHRARGRQKSGCTGYDHPAGGTPYPRPAGALNGTGRDGFFPPRQNFCLTLTVRHSVSVSYTHLYMLPPLFLLEAGTIRFQEGYSEKGRKGNHLYFSRNVKIAAKTLDRGGGMHYPIKHTKMIGNGGAGHEPGYHSAAAVPLAEPVSYTHLDVYKRQKQDFIPAIRQFFKRPGRRRRPICYNDFKPTRS